LLLKEFLMQQLNKNKLLGHRSNQRKGEVNKRVKITIGPYSYRELSIRRERSHISIGNSAEEEKRKDRKNRTQESAIEHDRRCNGARRQRDSELAVTPERKEFIITSSHSLHTRKS